MTNVLEPSLSERWEPGDLCSWRYRGKNRWQHTHVLRPTNDKDGSIKVWNERTGFPAYVPNVSECIKRRVG